MVAAASAYSKSLYIAQKQCMEIVRICAPLFSATPIQSFLYVELDQQGQLIASSSHASWLRDIYQYQWLACATIEDDLQRSSHLDYHFTMWSEYGVDSPWRQMMQRLGLVDGINVWHKEGDRWGLWSFGQFTATQDIEQFCVQYPNVLKVFMTTFSAQAACWLQQLVAYPSGMSTEKIQHLATQDMLQHVVQETPIKYFPILLHGQEQVLTYMQAICLHQISQGKTAKVIAKEVGLSYRTIEKHIENLKFLFDVSCKEEMISVYKASRECWW